MGIDGLNLELVGSGGGYGGEVSSCRGLWMLAFIICFC